MQSEITLHYNNLNQIMQAENINKIISYANLGKFKIQVIDCTYVIFKNSNNSLQVDLTDTTNISAKYARVRQQLTKFLNTNTTNLAINNYNFVSNNSNPQAIATEPKIDFTMLADKRLQSIENLTRLLVTTQSEIEHIDTILQTAKKKGGAYANSVLTDDELINSYNQKKSFIKEIQHKMHIEKTQLKTIKQLYDKHSVYINKNDFTMQRSIYEFVCSKCHYLEQQQLIEEIANVAEKIVSIAKKNNAAIVFPGRSLIACAAYIEKNYPQLKVLKIPLSSAKKIFKLNDSNEVNKICEYIANYLNKVSVTNDLLIADYVNSGGGLAAVQNIINIKIHRNKTISIAICSKYSKVKTNKELHKSGDISKSINFSYFLQLSSDKYSPLTNALQSSTFDEVSPYGKYEITKIIEGQSPPQWSQDGFNILKELF